MLGAEPYVTSTMADAMWCSSPSCQTGRALRLGRASSETLICWVMEHAHGPRELRVSAAFSKLTVNLDFPSTALSSLQRAGYISHQEQLPTRFGVGFASGWYMWSASAESPLPVCWLGFVPFVKR